MATVTRTRTEVVTLYGTASIVDTSTRIAPNGSPWTQANTVGVYRVLPLGVYSYIIFIYHDLGTN